MHTQTVAEVMSLTRGAVHLRQNKKIRLLSIGTGNASPLLKEFEKNITPQRADVLYAVGPLPTIDKACAKIISEGITLNGVAYIVGVKTDSQADMAGLDWVLGSNGLVPSFIGYVEGTAPVYQVVRKKA